MTITLHSDPVPLLVDNTGAIRVGQSRVTLDALLQYWRLGMKPEETRSRSGYPYLSRCSWRPGLLFPSRDRNRQLPVSSRRRS